MFILDCFERDMIKDVFLSKRQLGTNHLSVGYESSQLWVRIVWVRNVHGYETSGFPQNYKAFLEERCKKLGTNLNVNSFSIRSFLERTVVERANDYPCYKNFKKHWSYRHKIDRFYLNLPKKIQRNQLFFY